MASLIAPRHRLVSFLVVSLVVGVHVVVLSLSPSFMTARPKAAPDRLVTFVDLREPEPPKPVLPPPPTPPVATPQVPLPVITEKATTPEQEAQAVPASPTPVAAPPPAPISAPSAPVEPDYLPQFEIEKVPVMPNSTILAKTIYPPLAAKQGLEAVVILQLYIDDSGRIRKIDVLKDPGFGFAEAAVKALEGVVTQPAQAQGKPVAVKFRYAVRFKLK